MTDTRPSFPHYYLSVAQTVATRGDCTRSQVGCVIVSKSHMMMPGYNGTPEHGQPGCLEGACPRGRLSLEELPPYSGDYSDCISRHAEANAISKIFRSGLYREFEGSTAYVTREPCKNCYDLLAEWYIREVWWVTPEMNTGGSPGRRLLIE